MEFYDPQAIRNADFRAMTEIGVSGIVLMENAGRNAVDLMIANYPSVASVCILVGPGNNGGDGLVMARHFWLRKISVSIISSVSADHFQGASAINLKIAQSIGIPVLLSSEMSDMKIRTTMSSREICVDALLGTGSTGSPRGECARIISLLPKEVPVVSIDIPSGVDPVTGCIYMPCVKSELTITMLAPKTGLGTMPGAKHVGKIEIADIGVPPTNILAEQPRIQDVTEELVVSNLPERPFDMHKGNRGNVIAIGGASQYRGALSLTALGCLKTGSGLVCTFSSPEAQNTISTFLPEAITWGFSFERNELAAEELFQSVRSMENKSDSMIIGPGMGRTKNALMLTKKIWNEIRIPSVFDADSLYSLSETGTELSRRNDVILTPHEGEAARLLGIEPVDVKNNRLECARRLSTRWGVVLLKGAYTLIDDGLRTAVVMAGNPCLSIPGSGDILSGIISSLLATGLEPFNAASLGAWIHAQAGDELASNIGLDGILAREIAQRIPLIINRSRGISRLKTEKRKVDSR